MNLTDHFGNPPLVIAGAALFACCLAHSLYRWWSPRFWGCWFATARGLAELRRIDAPDPFRGL